MPDPKTYYEENALAWLRAGRAIFYQPEDHTGFGNRLRGLLGAFALALVSKRFLFVEDPLIDVVFRCPFKISWSARHYGCARRLSRQAVEYVWPLRPDNWSEGFWQRVSSKGPLEDFPLEPVIWYASTTSFYDAIMSNPYCRPFFEQLGVPFYNKIKSVGLFGQLLLKKLRPYWEQFLNDFKMHNVDLSEPVVEKIGVQYRSFADCSISKRSQEDFNLFLVKLINFIENIILINNNKKFFFVTSDDLHYRDEIVQKLKNFGSIYTISESVTFTGGNPWREIEFNNSVILLFYNKVIKIFRIIRSFFLKERPKLLRKAVSLDNLKNGFPDVIKEWLVLGECNILISSFTTFTIFSAARNGNRAVLYKIDPVNNFYGIIEKNDDYFL